MKILARSIGVLVILCTYGRGAHLEIRNQKDRVYDGGTYDKLIISHSSNITVRNCSFTATGSYSGNRVVDFVESNSHILVEDCDISGDSFACTGVNLTGSDNSYITVKGCVIHDIADDGMQIMSNHNIYILGNTICRLYGCGTTGGCGPCYNGHSDGIEITDADSVDVIGNLIYDVRSTAALMLEDWDDYLNTNVRIMNNIMYTPESGFVVYAFQTHGLVICNNTLWKGRYGGLCMGNDVLDMDVTNNILHSVNYDHTGTSYDAAEHRFDYNLIAVPNQGLALQPHDVYAIDPKFENIPQIYNSTPIRELTAADFALTAESPCIDKGTGDGPVPDDDFAGNSRSGTYDLGAYEYGVAGNGMVPGTDRTRFGTAPAYVNPGRMAIPGRFRNVAGNEVVFREPLTNGIYFLQPDERSATEVIRVVIAR